MILGRAKPECRGNQLSELHSLLSLGAWGCLPEALLVQGVRSSLKFTLNCLKVYQPKLLLKAILGHGKEHLYSAKDQAP